MNIHSTYTIDRIVPYFLKKTTTPLKLQKLLYYAQVWYFVKYKKLLFSDEIKAWVLGPVVPSVWQRFKFVKRNNSIPVNNHFYNLDQYSVDDHLADFLNNIWDSYGHLSGPDLVDLTHKETPWIVARQGLNHNDRSDHSVVINAKTTKGHQLDSFGRIPYVKGKNGLGFFFS